MNAKKILVCQHGGRHRYAIPRILESSGVLEGLYTDSSAGSALGILATAVPARSESRLRRLKERVVKGVPRQKVFSSDYPLFMRMLWMLRRERADALAVDERYGSALSKRMIRWGVREANVVYSMNRSHLEFVRYAKSLGCKSVIDIFINPLTEEILAAERCAIPEWAAVTPRAEGKNGERLWSEAVKEADLLLCPSEWVAMGLGKLFPECRPKISVVPYGSSIEYFGCENKPVPGRVFFAGGDVIRKGLLYLALATESLTSKLPNLEVRVAGDINETVSTDPRCSHINFLGKLSSTQMREEFLRADVFVLPSLSEGFAGVVVEAMTAGCPVIVTKESGAPIENGVEGVIVKARSSSDLVTALERMIRDRPFRDACALACLSRRDYFSEKEWGKRLTSVLEEKI